MDTSWSGVAPRMVPVSTQSTAGQTVSQNVSWNYADDGYIPTKCSQDVHDAGIFEVLAITFGIAIFLTNLIIVAAIKRGGRKLHKATFYCICNLAVADMLAGLLLLWIFGLQREVLLFRTPYSELVQKSVWTLTVWTSLLSQVVIAVDRYSHVTRSKGGATFPRGGDKRRKTRVMIGIFLTWFIPTVAFVIPVMTVWNCLDKCSCYVKADNSDVIYMVCLPVETCSQINPPFEKSSMLFLSLVLVLLPLTPVILYLKIFFFVRNSSKNLYPSDNKSGHIVNSGANTENGWHTKRGTEDSRGNYSKEESSGSKTEALITQEEHSALQHDTVIGGIIHPVGNRLTRKLRKKSYFDKPASSRRKRPGYQDQERGGAERRLDSYKNSANLCNASSHNGLRKRSQRRDMRLLRTFVIILGLFVVSTVPLGLLFFISLTETDKRYVQPVKYLLTLSLLNSLVNPWVYFWRFREMRHAIKMLFCSPCANDRQVARKRESRTGGCCHLPTGRKLSFFASTHSSKKGGSSSKDQSSSSAL